MLHEGIARGQHLTRVRHNRYCTPAHAITYLLRNNLLRNLLATAHAHARGIFIGCSHASNALHAQVQIYSIEILQQ